MESAIVNKDSFRDWKANPVTKHIMNVLKDRVDMIADELSKSAGIDPNEDRYKVGACEAYRDLLNISFEDVHND